MNDNSMRNVDGKDTFCPEPSGNGVEVSGEATSATSTTMNQPLKQGVGDAQKAAILLIYTGGTIGMKTDPESGVLVPFDFNDIYDEFPYLKKLAVDIEVLTFTPIDSSNVTPELWVRLVELIRDNYNRFDGFVILHGTDTMSYTASALSFMLENVDKPLVFTGSQIPIGVLRTDGRENLITAIEIAAAKNGDSRAVVPEVCLYFQNKLFRANRTTKYSAEELSAFRSDNYPALADVGVNIQYNTPFIHKVTRKTEQLKIRTSLETGVVVIKIFPGISESILHAMLNIDGVKAVVLETYGAGNAPTSQWFLAVVKEALSRGVIVMNVTQCMSGSVHMEVYETGILLQKMGVVSGADITTEAAVTKLMSLLGANLSNEELTRCLKNPIRGEISL